jgi:hypothetical protein
MIPMVSLIEGPDIRATVDKIITGSATFLYLASRDFSLPAPLKEHVDYGMARTPDIRLYYRNRFIVSDKSDIVWLKEHRNVRVFVCDLMNINIFMNESTGIVTSFNLFEPTGRSLIDLGIFFSKTADELLFSRTLGAIGTIEGQSHQQTDFYPSPGRNREKSQYGESSTKSTNESGFFSKFFHEALGGGGYCITCGAPVSYQRNRPFCPHCMNKRTGCPDPDENGFYCHNCGAAARVTIRVPFCRHCLSDIGTV